MEYLPVAFSLIYVGRDDTLLSTRVLEPTDSPSAQGEYGRDPGGVAEPLFKSRQAIHPHRSRCWSGLETWYFHTRICRAS